MSEQKTIHAALADVMADVQAVAKKDRNNHQKFMFRGIDAVVNAVGPALRKHRVVVTPEVVSANYETVATSTGKASTACRLVVSYVFRGPAGDTISATVAGEAWDSGDKATPKAMSVAFRTALLQALALPTDEPDPDEHVYERANDTDWRGLIDSATDADTLRALYSQVATSGLPAKAVEALREKITVRGKALAGSNESAPVEGENRDWIALIEATDDVDKLRELYQEVKDAGLGETDAQLLLDAIQGKAAKLQDKAA